MIFQRAAVYCTSCSAQSSVAEGAPERCIFQCARKKVKVKGEPHLFNGIVVTSSAAASVIVSVCVQDESWQWSSEHEPEIYLNHVWNSLKVSTHAQTGQVVDTSPRFIPSDTRRSQQPVQLTWPQERANGRSCCKVRIQGASWFNAEFNSIRNHRGMITSFRAPLSIIIQQVPHEVDAKLLSLCNGGSPSSNRIRIRPQPSAHRRQLQKNTSACEKPYLLKSI